MKCPKCKTENPLVARFCLRCGTRLVQVCAKCGTELPPEATFCLACGVRVHVSSTEPGEKAVAPDAVAERLQRLVPRELAERLLSARGEVRPERRIVTILFCDVKGSTAMAERLDPEDVMEIMDGAFDVLIEPIVRYEGTVARLMGDAVLAFFGAPMAHEDDPERAIRAALDIIEGAKQYAAELEQERGITGFDVRVGIHTGLVVVGEIGSDLRVEYTAMGDAINVAARMEQSAPPGGILITHDTYRHVRGVFDVLPQEPLTVKGRHQLVQTYLVQRAKPRAFRKPMRGVEGIETRMIGRQAELSRLQEAFYTAIEDRELQVFTITGEAGVGKSRLLHEFDLWAELLPQSYFFFKGRALQEMQTVPYSLIRDLFAFRLQIEDTDPLLVVREKLEHGAEAAFGAGEGSQMRAHFIGRLLGFEFGPSSHLAGVLDDPKQVHDRALTYLVEYFQALASQNPVLILLEDLHCADDSSLDVLNHLALALNNEPIMMACAARPALFERRPHWGEGQAFYRRLGLEPLTKRNTRHLLREILQKVDQVPETLSELVVAGAEGNPFFVEELVKMLVEDGVVVKGQERWRVEPSRLRDVRVPSTLQGLLQARLDRLPIEDRTVLQQASVVGRQFWDGAVVRINERAVEGPQEREVLDTLSDLREREMVFQRETTAFAGTQEYIFKHAVLREVTYQSLLKRLRRIYHGLVADWLMEQAGERVGEYTGLIAEHLELAGRAGEAVEWLLQAGDRARELYAHQEAIQAYQRALALLQRQGDRERAARTWMKLGLTYHTAFQFSQARQAYEQGCTLWHEVPSDEPAVPPPPAPHALRVAAQEPMTVDPGLADDLASGLVVHRLFSGLLGLTPDMNVVPDVAKSWDMLKGGRRYVFHLRDDVCWSDGTRLTASDFEFAWKRALDPAARSDNANLLYPVKGARAYHQGDLAARDRLGVVAVDDMTLAVELEEPTGCFLQLVTYCAAAPVPRHVVEAYGASWTDPGNLVCNGAYRLVAWEPGVSMVLERNPAYHGRYIGNVSQVRLLFASPDRGELLAMYEQDELDCLPYRLVPGDEHEAARQRHAGEHYSQTTLGTLYLGFDCGRPPFDDPRVRLAFSLATDRDKLANVTLKGEFSPATGGFVPPGMPGHSSGIALPYDPEAARDLLRQAGYPNGHGFPPVEGLAAAAPLFARAITTQYLGPAWLENLGVHIAWTVLESAEFFDRLDVRVSNLWEVGWGVDYPDPDNFLRAAPWRRQTRWCNAAFGALVEGASRVTDQEERMRRYREAEHILVQEAPIVPLLYQREALLVKPWVTRLVISPGWHWLWQDVVIEPH
jgi:ABC-type oligopeptide transport system substrate-binding subunit/class 3 adenylate cyclase/ribosomal protein L40E/tetratricopeptide (TPR) repeat protein